MRQNLAETVNPSLTSLDISTRIVNACADVKAKDIKVFDVSRISDLFSYYIVVSGQSDRQVQGIANRVIDNLRTGGPKPVAVEGLDTGHWVIIDYGDVILHVFYEPLRSHYDLEGLWTRARKVEVRKKPRSRSLMLRP